MIFFAPTLRNPYLTTFSNATHVFPKTPCTPQMVPKYLFGENILK